MNSTQSTAVARAEALAQVILEAIGEENVISIFAGGSLARNEVAAFATEDGVEIYSDIDLYVIVVDGCDGAVVRGRVRDAVDEFDRAPTVGDVTFVAPSDVGVYKRADLGSLVPRPGTVCLRDATLLHGKGDVMETTPDDITAIAPDEALYLIENRMTEMSALEERDDPAGKRYAAYHGVKLCLDVGTALLIAGGKYSCSSSARMESLRALGTPDATTDGDTIEKAYASRNDLQEAFTRTTYPDSSTAKDLALSAYRAICEEMGGESGGDWVDVIERRCRKGKSADNLREFVAMRGRQGRGKLSSFRMAVGLSSYSPVSALRVSGVARHAVASNKEDAVRLEEIDDFVERLTRRCGFVEGTISERVMEMNRSLR